MAATANTSAASIGESIGSARTPPRRTYSGAARTSSPTWHQNVRGAESEALFTHPPQPSDSLVMAVVPAPEIGCEVNNGHGKAGSSPEGPEVETQLDGSDNGNGSKKAVWNKPYNAALESSLVMGAVSWPTLSESTKGSPKTPSADSLKNPSDALIFEGPDTTTIRSCSLAVSSSAPQKPVASNPNPNATRHHGQHRQKSTKQREGGENLSSNGGFSDHYTQSSSMGDPLYTSNSSLKSGSGVSDSSARDHGHKNAARDGGQRSGQQRNYRRSKSGPHMCGDGSFSGRRDQDHVNHDWNRRRSFNGRDPYVPPQRVGQSSFTRAPPSAAAVTYIPPPIQPCGGPMGLPPEMQPLYYFASHPGMPFVAQMPPAVYYPAPDPQLHVKIINQIDYYFSNENLIKDTYLRQNMDDQGWVPVQLIANFKKVMQLTTDMQQILDAVRVSTVVELQGDKIRIRDDWNKWIMPPSVQFPTAAGSQSPPMLQDALPAHVQGLSLDENTDSYSNSGGHDVHTGVSLRSSSGEINGQPESSDEGRSSSGY